VIASIFELEIYYDLENEVYRINEDEFSEISKRRIEAFDTFNALKIGDKTAEIIHFESRKPLGTENLFGLIHAIKNRLKIKFTYLKYWEEEPLIRSVEAYALKEFKNRWYVVAKDDKEGKIKTFALDRLTQLEITNIQFRFPKDFNIEEYFRFCFGIISSNDEQPEEIVLSFDPIQGKYIKSLPLHKSQEVLVDNKIELRVKLILCITYDLIMELLSYGDYLTVLEPPKLIETIKNDHKSAYSKYRGL